MKTENFIIILVALCISACSSGNEQQLHFEKKGREVPAFNTDSAYTKIVRQVEIGPRNPGSKGHAKAEAYLMAQLEHYAGSQNVFSQHFTHTGYDGDTLQMTNLIAAFNVQSTDRILLCAHWDTRPRGEKDETNPDQPIIGADDGASGVGVLLEMARLFSENPPPIGVDIIFFDGEDYGREGDLANYFLGSRYWSNYPPVKGYQPRFGILLDMVGAKGAQFFKEGNSMDFAPALVNEIWSIAQQQEYDSLFIDSSTPRISDDHMVINRIRNIPMIDIINHSTGEDGALKFAPYWHTQNDDLDIIDKNTLKAVGEVLSELIYNRI